LYAGGDINFEDLTVEEKKLFQRAMASGELSKMIEPWEPWWLKPSARTISLSREGTRLIQPIVGEEISSSNAGDFENKPESDVPAGPEAPLPPLSRLTSAEPSPLLAIHLVDILYSYCFTLRLYNGDWQSDACGAVMVILSVSSVLGQAVQPQSVLEAVSCCLEQTCSPAFRHVGGLQFGFAVVDDVTSLFSLGGVALVCALCDLQRLIQAAERELKSEKPRKANRTEVKSKLKAAERKIYFIMCWAHEQPEEVWSSLSALVKAEKASAMECQGNRPLKAEKPNNKSKTLIEEV